MRAILFALAEPSHFAPTVEGFPPCLLRVADKPILVHIIENLAQHGIKKIDLILHDYPDLIEEVVGDGTRWGLMIETHLVKDLATPLLSVHAAAAQWTDEILLVGRAERLPNFPETIGTHEQILRIIDNSWSGWLVIRRESLLAMKPTLPLKMLPKELGRTATYTTVGSLFSCQTPVDWLGSNERVLQEPLDPLWFPPTARQQEPGVWVSAGAEVHPSAKLLAPVFIGKDAHVAADCRVGPFAIVESHCLIDTDTEIKHSLICHDSYVGEKLSLSRSIVNRTQLRNFEHKTHLTITDDFILSGLTPASPGRHLLSFFERIAASLVLALASPVLLVQLIRDKVRVREIVAVPGDGSHVRPWLTSLGMVRQGDVSHRKIDWIVLYHVICGEAHFAGVRPRTPEEVAQLPTEWRELYCSSKLGWLTLAHLQSESPTEEDLSSSDAYYAAHASPWFDLKTIWEYVVLRVWRRR